MSQVQTSALAHRGIQQATILNCFVPSSAPYTVKHIIQV